MSLALKRFRVYLKIAAILAVLVVVLLVVFMNRNNTADIWLFKAYADVNVVWLILVTAVSSVVLWWGVRKVAGVIREYREMQRLNRDAHRLDEQRRLAAELSEREKRIDEKVNRAITDDE